MDRFGCVQEGGSSSLFQKSVVALPSSLVPLKVNIAIQFREKKMSSRESDSDELLRRYSSYGGDTCNPQQLRRLVSMTNSNFGDLPTEPQYYSIPELEMLSSVVASMKSSPSSSMPAIYQFQAEGNGEMVSQDMGNCRPEWQEYWKWFVIIFAFSHTRNTW